MGYCASFPLIKGDKLETKFIKSPLISFKTLIARLLLKSLPIPIKS